MLSGICYISSAYSLLRCNTHKIQRDQDRQRLPPRHWHGSVSLQVQFPLHSARPPSLAPSSGPSSPDCRLDPTQILLLVHIICGAGRDDFCFRYPQIVKCRSGSEDKSREYVSGVGEEGEVEMRDKVSARSACQQAAKLVGLTLSAEQSVMTVLMGQSGLRPRWRAALTLLSALMERALGMPAAFWAISQRSDSALLLGRKLTRLPPPDILSSLLAR